MDRDRETPELLEKLFKCRRLASDYDDGATANNLNDLAAELEQQLRALEE